MDSETRDFLEQMLARLSGEHDAITHRSDAQFSTVFERFDRLERAFLRLAESVVSAGEVKALQHILEIERPVSAIPPALGTHE